MNQEIVDFINRFSKDELYEKMTKAYSRQLFENLAEHLISKKIPFSLFFIDFDTFKKVNDTLGHQYGDQALTDVVNMIKLTIKDRGILARYGGDEFAILVPEVIEKQDVWQIARDYSQYVRNHPLLYLRTVFSGGRITLTSGIVRYPIDATCYRDLLHLADKALYRGKAKGKNCFIIYEEKIHGNIDVSQGYHFPSTTEMLKNVFSIFDSSDDTLNNLRLASSYIARIYHENLISYHDDQTKACFYWDKSVRDLTYHDFDPEHLHLDNEDIKFISRLNIKDREEYRELIEDMNISHIHSLIVFVVTSPDGNKGYFYIQARRDRIWLDAEIQIYQTIALLFSSLNIHQNQLKKKAD